MQSPSCDPFELKRMDTKSTPTKEESVPDTTSNQVLQKLQQTAPEWFVEAFSYLVKELNTLKSEHIAADKVKTELETEIRVLETKVVNLEGKLKKQNETVNQLNEKITNLEMYSRRDNLIVEGIAESPNEDIKGKIFAFFQR